MTERLGQLPFSSSQFNSDVRASIQPLEEQVIYAAYNSTNGRGNCSKSPLILLFMTYGLHTCIATCKCFQSRFCTWGEVQEYYNY